MNTAFTVMQGKYSYRESGVNGNGKHSSDLEFPGS